MIVLKTLDSIWIRFLLQLTISFKEWNIVLLIKFVNLSQKFLKHIVNLLKKRLTKFNVLCHKLFYKQKTLKYKKNLQSLTVVINKTFILDNLYLSLHSFTTLKNTNSSSNSVVYKLAKFCKTNVNHRYWKHSNNWNFETAFKAVKTNEQILKLVMYVGTRKCFKLG